MEDIKLDDILDDDNHQKNTSIFKMPKTRFDKEETVDDKTFKEHRTSQDLDHAPGSVKSRHLEQRIRTFLENFIQGEGEAVGLEPLRLVKLIAEVVTAETITGQEIFMDVFLRGNKTITEDITITDEYNQMSIGTITIADGVTVTLEGEWVIV